MIYYVYRKFKAMHPNGVQYKGVEHVGTYVSYVAARNAADACGGYVK
jgi:hypothetical protein